MSESVKTHTTHHVELAASTAYGNSFDAIYVGVSGNIDIIVGGVTAGYDNVPVGPQSLSGDGIAASTTADSMVLLSW